MHHAPTAGPRTGPDTGSGRRDAFAPLLQDPLAALFREHVREGSNTHGVPTAGAPEPVTVYDDGVPRVNLGSNNYLGLAGDERVVEAAVAAVRRYGTSTSGSRVLNRRRSGPRDSITARATVTSSSSIWVPWRTPTRATCATACPSGTRSWPTRTTTTSGGRATCCRI